ncbi:hypothetical protein AYI69_g2749 [Smittium culicis]|uniref:Uncharacterized protein n=1 Tax=Smittium culicis TaxID=133412 RepID=A0A1R1YLJ4_9FUNG|nr:hypothetical protein AYI69_g2749 [Smittium culicis]
MRAYEKAMRIANVSNASNCYLVDDSKNNVVAANKFGWKGVLVSETKPDDFDGECIHDIYKLPGVLTDIFSE